MIEMDKKYYGYGFSTNIENTKFVSNLLILSACNTAKPDPSGKYFSGLMRSFLYSGSRNLLATLWGIETFSAEELTTNFFETSSYQYADSLKKAQLSYLMKQLLLLMLKQKTKFKKLLVF